MSNQHSNIKPELLNVENRYRQVGDVDEDVFTSPMSGQSNRIFTSPWLGVTSNSDCSYSSGSESNSMSDESDNNVFQPSHTFKPVNDKSKMKILTIKQWS